MSLNINTDEPRRPRRPDPSDKLPGWVWHVGIPVCVLIVVGLVYVVVNGPVFETPKINTGPRDGPLDAGEFGVLGWASTENRLVAVDYEAYEEMAKASQVKDTLGLAAMIEKDRLFLVAGKTRVLVLSAHTFSSEIRIQDGPSIGRKGWIGKEYVVREREPQVEHVP